MGLGLVLTYDTRDNAYFPTKNFYFEARSMSYLPVFDAHYTYTRSLLDMRAFTSMDVAGETVVLAGQMMYDATFGEAPFYDLPTYGGDAQMRGILRGRYIDAASIVGQLEIRSRIWWKLGLSAFVSVGDVAPATDKFSLAHTKLAGGGGIRVYIDRDESITGRLDFGFSEWGSAVYFTFGEAF